MLGYELRLPPQIIFTSLKNTLSLFVIFYGCVNAQIVFVNTIVRNKTNQNVTL
jgi:hypothetical protein